MVCIRLLRHPAKGGEINSGSVIQKRACTCGISDKEQPGKNGLPTKPCCLFYYFEKRLTTHQKAEDYGEK